MPQRWILPGSEFILAQMSLEVQLIQTKPALTRWVSHVTPDGLLTNLVKKRWTHKSLWVAMRAAEGIKFSLVRKPLAYIAKIT